MKFRTLGRTGLRVSLASLGTGGARQFGQNSGLSASEQDSLVATAINQGINLFDTSAAYGDAESILGRSLASHPRDSYFLATKWPQEKHAPDGSEIAQSPHDLVDGVEASLLRLRTDYIDVMQFHGLKLSYYNELVERFAPVMDRLRTEGKVRFWGFSEWASRDHDHEAVIHALKRNPELWDTVMFKYNLLSQSAAVRALPAAIEHDVGVMVMAPVRKTLPDPVALEARFQRWKSLGEIAPDEVPDEKPLDWLLHGDVRSIPEAAYKFASAHPAVSSVLSGTADVSHLADNVTALNGAPLPESDFARITSLLGNISDPVAE